jgi:hypothetical protein
MNTYRNSSKIRSIGPGQRPHQPCLSAPAGPARSLLAENKKLEVRVVRIHKKKAKVPDPLLTDAVGGGEETDTGMADLLFAVNLTNN